MKNITESARRLAVELSLTGDNFYSIKEVATANGWGSGWELEVLRGLVEETILTRRAPGYLNYLFRDAGRQGCRALQEEDLEWFLPLVDAYAGWQWHGNNSAQEINRGVMNLLRDKKVLENARERILRGDHKRLWSVENDIHAGCDFFKEDKKKQREELLKVLSDRYVDSVAPTKARVMDWEAVCGIARSLTNQLSSIGEIDEEKVYMSSFSNGPMRDWELEEGRRGKWCPVISRSSDGWMAFEEEDVSFLMWESGSSGCRLEARKVTPGTWEVRFYPSMENPSYRGTYYFLWEGEEEDEGEEGSAEASWGGEEDFDKEKNSRMKKWNRNRTRQKNKKG